MLPEGLVKIYGNFTPRDIGYMPKQAKDIVVFGTQYTFRYVHEQFKETFFEKEKEKVLREIKFYLSSYTGRDYDVSHFAELHDLGYLPIKVNALEEGTIIGPKIPVFTIENTHERFGWLTLFLETLVSSLMWKPMHSASMAFAYKKIVAAGALATNKAAMETIDFLAHDFSMRGMQHPEAAMSSGLGWLTSFCGTDTIPALWGANHYYDSVKVGYGVPATEHSVMTSYGKEDEFAAFNRLLDLFPSGFLSIVSDSFDLWGVCTDFVPRLKEKILARDGKLVIRPDSGNPVDILCGKKIREYDNVDAATEDFRDNLRCSQVHGLQEFTIDTERIVKIGTTYLQLEAEVYFNRHDKQYYFIDSVEFIVTNVEYHPSFTGVVELLWDALGGTISDEGYKVLDSHIGVIYGDAITLDRAEEIHKRLKAKGFATTNIVFGVGSYSMGYATRDQQGCAVKATYCELRIDDQLIQRNIFKDPITDSGIKKSAKGRLVLIRDSKGILRLKDECTDEDMKNSLLQPIYVNGKFFNKTTIHDIRKRIKNQLHNEFVPTKAA